MPISEQICLKLIYTVFIQYTQTKKRRQCMHLQSYMYSFTKLQLQMLTVRACARACVRVSDPRFIQFALGSC